MTADGMSPGSGRGTASRRAAALAWAVALLAVTFCASARILGTFHDPKFDRVEVAGLLRSDPGLLYYITERILDADGGVPADFHADPRVQHPDRVDLARMFTVGQEFLVAWAYRALGGDTPLHVFCVVFFSILAALTVLGVFGAAYELSGRWRCAALAALFYASLPVNYRTTGFILIREDLSLPLFAAHLWTLARLRRRPSTWAAVLCGLLLSAALATWHAMGFVVALELAALACWYVASGQNPFAQRAAWIVLGVVVATTLTVPVLRAKLFLTSIPVVLAASLALARVGDLRSARHGWPFGARRAAIWITIVLGLYAVSSGSASLLSDSAGDYGHVLALMLAKLRHLGQLPADPSLLPFDVRLLWQGPFSTAAGADLALGMPHAVLGLAFALACAVHLARRGRLDGGLAVAVAFLCLGFAAGLLVRRTLVIPGLAAPIAVVVAFQRLGRVRLATGVVGLAAALGATLVTLGLSRAPLEWYAPPQRVQELKSLVRFVEQNVPPDAAILGDFVASTSILAHSGHAIALQPKYETALTRRRIEEFYTTFARGTPADLRELAQRLECDYLLVDTEMLWWSGRAILGVPFSQQVPDAGTCAYFFVNRNPAALDGVPGFELVYRSPPELGMDLFRLYRVH